jgi:hypothetical protein
MLKLEVLVFKRFTIDRPSSSSVEVCEIATCVNHFIPWIMKLGIIR